MIPDSAYLTELKVCNGGVFRKRIDSCQDPRKKVKLEVGSKVGMLGGGAGRRMDSLGKKQLDPLHHSSNPYTQITGLHNPGHIRFTFWGPTVMDWWSLSIVSR